MKKQNKVIKPNVVGGGVAIPLGNNFYFMSGRKHEQGGIDIGHEWAKDKLEVEHGEVMQMGGKHVKVYSSLPILNGKSPAQLVMAGVDPNKVFNAQERFKRINKLNDDGSRKKAEYGMLENTDGHRIIDTNKNFTPDKPADSFLGSDYVHNFIKNNKEAMGVGVDSFNTPAHKINTSYMQQALNGGTNVNAETNTLLKNRQEGNNAKTYLNLTHRSYETPKYFPNRSTEIYITNTHKNGEVDSTRRIKTYLPSMGYFTNEYKYGGTRKAKFGIRKKAEVGIKNETGILLPDGDQKALEYENLAVNEDFEYDKKEWPKGFRASFKSTLMDLAHAKGEIGDFHFIPRPFASAREKHGGSAQAYYLYNRKKQDEAMKKDGYISVPLTGNKKEDYGLVTKAVGNNDYPVYQTKEDAITRDKLVAIGNINDAWLGGEDAKLIHAGSYPSTIYVDGRNLQLFQKAWDLNDYGRRGTNSGGRSYEKYYSDIEKKGADLLDKHGSPTVITTGYQPMTYKIRNEHDYYNGGFIKDDYDIPEVMDKLKTYLKDKNILHSYIDETDNKVEYIGLPEMIVTPKKQLGGVNRHYTINGNVVNKAGYVPSTGEIPKANLGTVTSIDKWVTRKDKDGRVANALRADIQKQIDTYNASKKYRDAKSAEIKRKTLFDREKEISRNPNEYDKIENDINLTNNKVTVVKPTLFKPETKEKTNNEGYAMKPTDTKKNGILAYKDENNKSIKKEKNKTNANNLNINSLYPNRFGVLTNPTIKLEGNDVPLFALPQLVIEAINRKLKFSSKKDVDPESKGLNIPKAETVKVDTLPEINLDTSPKIEIAKPVIEKYPSKITGDTIMYTGPSNMGGRRYYLPQSIDLGSVKGDYRNRGDYRDIKTEGLVLPTMNEFYRADDLTPETLAMIDPKNFKALMGVDKDGNIKFGQYSDFGPDDMVSVVSYDRIRGFNKNEDGSIKWAPRSDRWSDKYVFTETTAINPITGEDETGSVNVGGSRANPTDKAYGFLNGGHVVIRAGNETRLISGSVKDIDKEIEKMKTRNNVDEVEFFMLDNGTYNLGLRTKDGMLTASDLKRYDNQNTAGGHGIYLKRFGGKSNRQKAEVGKNIFSPRGLGIKATMAKMQADAWDKKYPGEDNPFAQQFIDEFGDPTIYSSIMSDNAGARGLGIDRGYKGNRGLGWVMPELPSINLDNYFDTQGDSIVRADRGGSAGGGDGVAGGKRPETKITPLGLEAITVKPQGLTVEPVKPPTQLTFKTPEVETETKNKGTWWRDNGSDLISGLAKGGASLASYLINRNMLNDLKYTGQPIFTPAAKLKTKININPQIDAVNRTTAARNRVAEESASSKVRNARINANYIDRLGYLNELYGMKENKETELINADKLNQQEITKGNIQAYNDWVEKKQNFDNTVREKQSENAVSFVSNLASGVDDILTNRQKRKQFKQNVAAYMASHPNVSPELLESYGLDIFDNKKIIEKRVIKPNKENYKGTGKTKKEYADWLKEKDPAKYEIWAKREKYNRN